MNAPEKITAAEPMNAAHEILMKAASGMCSQEIAAAITGTPRPTKPQIKAAEKMLKAIHDCGMLASQPGRGGVALYSLTTPVSNINEMGDVSLANEGKTAEVCDLVQTGGESQTSQSNQSDDPVLHALGVMTRIASAARDLLHESEEFDFPDGLGRGAQQQFWDALGSEIEAAENDGAQISDELPPADPVMLANANRMLSDRLEGVAHALRGCGLPALADVSGAEDLQMATAALSGAYQMAMAELAAEKHGDNELLEQARVVVDLRAQISSLTADLMRTRASVNSAINEADRMRSELAIERQARQALQEKVNAAPAPAHKGYVLKTPKRAMRRFGEEAAAQSAAMAAARAGKVSEVFALVPVGKAVRGAEWKVAS